MRNFFYPLTNESLVFFHTILYKKMSLCPYLKYFSLKLLEDLLCKSKQIFLKTGYDLVFI